MDIQEQDRTPRERQSPPAGTAGGSEARTDDDTSDIRQFVTFVVGKEVFAVDMAPVQEIIRVPEVVRVPLAPPTLDGLANLRGKVLPIFSLHRIFGIAEHEYDDATRALVIDLGQPLGFVVDRVVSVVGVESARIEGVGSLEGTMNADLLSGIIKDVGGHDMIMVLDFARLIAREFAGVAAAAARTALTESQAESADGRESESADELQLVSFDVAGQEYAIAIEDVQEIVQMPEHIVQVPQSASHALGLMTLRNRLLPLVSLRRMFGLPEQGAEVAGRIVVVSLGTASVGIVMDSVNAVLHVSRADVDATPPLLASDGDLSDIAQICRLDGGARLVSIISAANLFRHTSITQALTTVDQTVDEQEQQGVLAEESRDDDEQMVVFRLAKEEFGVPIECVQEIVRVPDELTQVPRSPTFVEGVINLRGAVLPVIDLRRRLGLESAERSDRQRVMVFVIDGVRTGYIVDSVAEVLRIHKSAIGPAPRLNAEPEPLLARVANLQQQKRMVQLIAPSHLIEGPERLELARLEA